MINKKKNEPIGDVLIKELEYECAQYPDILEYLLDQFHIPDLKSIPKSHYEVFRKRIIEIKNSRNGLNR